MLQLSGSGIGCKTIAILSSNLTCDFWGLLDWEGWKPEGLKRVKGVVVVWGGKGVY